MKGKEKTMGSESQPERFKRAAREIGCDEDEAAFEERLRKIAKAVPPKPAPKRKAKG